MSRRVSFAVPVVGEQHMITEVPRADAPFPFQMLSGRGRPDQHAVDALSAYLRAAIQERAAGVSAIHTYRIYPYALIVCEEHCARSAAFFAFYSEL